MVHFPGFAPSRLWIQRVVPWFFHGGFPHSEIPGSMPACGSPGLIAACHVLHRLLLPRHPPCALSSLTIKFTRRSPSTAPGRQLVAASPTPAPGKPRESTALDLLLASPLWPRLPAPPSQNLARRKPRRTDLSEDTPADLSALKKFTQPCRLPNRFSCQTSSSSRLSGKVEHRCPKFIPSLAEDQLRTAFARHSRLTARHWFFWWSWPGSNRRPPACKAGALPAELQPHSSYEW